MSTSNNTYEPDPMPGVMDRIKAAEDVPPVIGQVCPLKRLVAGILAAATVNVENGFCSEYGGYEYDIERDDSDDTWYIQVSPFEQGFIYDGWWHDSEDKTL